MKSDSRLRRPVPAVSIHELHRHANNGTQIPHPRMPPVPELELLKGQNGLRLYFDLTSIPRAVRLSHGLSWLENVYFSMSDLAHTVVGQTHLVFGVRTGFISRSVRARLQVSVCNGYTIGATLVNVQKHRQKFRQTAFWPAYFI